MALKDEDDLEQAGMIGAWVALKSFKPDKGANLKTWAGLKINGYIQEEYRRLKLFLPLLDDDRIDDIDFDVIHDSHILSNTIKELPDDQKRVLELYMKDQELYDIEKILGWSRWFVRKNYNAAIKSLKASLHD